MGNGGHCFVGKVVRMWSKKRMNQETKNTIFPQIELRAVEDI
jgi:hypothetical protein